MLARDHPRRCKLSCVKILFLIAIQPKINILGGALRDQILDIIDWMSFSGFGALLAPAIVGSPTGGWLVVPSLGGALRDGSVMFRGTLWVLMWLELEVSSSPTVPSFDWRVAFVLVLGVCRGKTTSFLLELSVMRDFLDPASVTTYKNRY